MKPVCLVVLDGWGINKKKDGNAVAAAETPNFDRLWSEYPSTALDASGMAVGLPDGQMGNSEVGHLTLGAGRIIYQDFTRINKAIENGEFSENPVMGGLLDTVKREGTALHVMGLVSDGGVHSHIDHLYAILEAARKKGLQKVFVHAFLDGRDTMPSVGINYIRDLAEWMEKKGTGRISTVSGRYYAMDRDNRWPRVEKAYSAVVTGRGLKSDDPVRAVENAYKRGETDEFVTPTVITDGGPTPIGTVSEGDGGFFFNFRADRARELTRALTEKNFKEFDVSGRPSLSGFITMTPYDKKFDLPVVFKPQSLEKILGYVLSSNGVGQFRVSETEKYAHVTYFFNGGNEEPFEGEDRLLIPSSQAVDTYDKEPEMKASDIADAAVERINSGEYRFMLMNFANGDMVGHTGVFDAAVRGCEAVDRALGRVADAALEKGWAVIVTADHGNAEEMVGDAQTAHSMNQVPLILADDGLKGAKLAKAGGLRDVAPTVLKLMGIDKPSEMDGKALF